MKEVQCSRNKYFGRQKRGSSSLDNLMKKGLIPITIKPMVNAKMTVVLIGKLKGILIKNGIIIINTDKLFRFLEYADIYCFSLQ